jgi:hypothetical protein
MSPPAQSFERHARMVPLYHYVATAFLMIPTVYFGWVAVTDFSVGALMLFLFGVGVVVLGFFARTFPLGVQDRVIRLEERLRLERLLPDDLRGRALEITTDQLIALRFASDEELAELVRRVLGGELRERKSIKQAVRSWRADHQRI